VFATADQGGSQNPADRNADRSLSEFDLRYRLASSYLYELPHFRGTGILKRALTGWELGGIITLQSGSPVNILTGQDNSRTGVGFDRPDLVGNTAMREQSRGASVAQHFNTAAFQPNALGHYGNLGRNVIIGPGVFDMDISLAKRIAIREGSSLQLRGDSFDVLNRPNFGAPGNTITAAGFGRITPASNGRILQVSMKYIF